jgi:photosystem II stability/assembly factor-like uncharacterized protein
MRRRTDVQPSFTLLLWLFLGLAALALVLPASAFAAENRWTPLGRDGGEVPLGWDGGEVQSLALDPADPDTLLAATGAAGLYKSTDGGDSWAWSGTGMAGWIARRVVSDFSRPGTFYTAAAPYDSIFPAGSATRLVFRSTDGGVRWERVFEVDPSAEGPIRNLAAAGGRVYVLTARRLSVSADTGATWSQAYTSAADDLTALAVDLRNPGTAYLSTVHAGLFKSVDGGITWTGLHPPVGDFRAVAVAPSRSATLYLLTGQALYHSDDAGITWSAGTPLPGFAGELAVDPVRASIVYAFGFDLAVSRDGGATLRLAENGLPPGQYTRKLPVRGLAIRPDRPGTVYAGTDAEGVYRSTDGGRLWRPAANAGLAARVFLWVRVNPRIPSQIYAQTAAGQLFRSVDGGVTWARFGAEIRPFGRLRGVAFDLRNPHILYAAGDPGVFRSLDEGATWSSLGFDRGAIDVLAIDGHTLLAGTEGGLFRTTDAGRTWDEVLDDSIPPPDNEFYAGRIILWMKSDPADPRTIYARAEDHIAHAGSGDSYLVRSTDGGATWLPLRFFDVMEIEPGHPRTLYAADADHVFRSLDGGDTWQPLGALPKATDLEVDPHSSNTIYAGTAANGVYRSTDGGATWAPINAGLARLGRRYIVDLEVNPAAAGLVYAAPFEGGLFQARFSDAK